MDLQETRLWKQFSKKAKKDTTLIDEVRQYCQGAITLSAQITRFFPNYTLHDGTHLTNVCEWMHTLIHSRLFNNLTVNELAFLMMVACSHDLGMIVSDDEKVILGNQAKENKTAEWQQYYLRHPQDKALLPTETDRILRNFVRENHHLRAKHYIDNVLPWPHSATLNLGITKELLFNVCKSHNENLSFISGSTDKLDVNFAAVLLRLADALDYDSSRAPELLYRFLGLDDPRTNDEKKSDVEWTKNRAGKFDRTNPSTLVYRSTEITQPEIYQDLVGYIGWINKELPKCISHLGEHSTRWGGNNNMIPALIKLSITPDGFKSADFKLRMDQDKILELLSGDGLYDNPGVFVRELLQNSIDAVLTRCVFDNQFSVEDGRINVDVWQDGELYWFRIQDNGIGMDERIINEYFLNVGNSYYSSNDGFVKDLAKRNIVQHFTPISRFGIGILSCFMGYNKEGLIEVSTKRYSSPSEPLNNAYRIDITGLNGLYFLTELSPNQKGRPMHGPKGPVVDSYKRDIGTTICLRVNMLSLGIDNFITIMNQYVFCPEIRVEYNGPDGKKIFHTEQELTTVLNRLNPEFGNRKVAKEHISCIRDDDYAYLMNLIPEANWDQAIRPMIRMRYWPVQQMTMSNNLGGAIISCDLLCENVPISVVSAKGHVLTSSLFWRHGLRPNSGASLYLELDEDVFSKLDDALDFSDKEKLELEDKLSDICERLNNSCIDFVFSDDEKELYAIIDFFPFGAPIAYNGIVVKKQSVDELTDYTYATRLLLKNDYRPEVSMSRDYIRSLPLEALCDIAIQYYIAGVDISQFNFSILYTYSLDEYFKVLNKHPEWKNILLLAASRKETLSSFSFEEIGGQLILDSVDNDVSRIHITVRFLVALVLLPMMYSTL